MIGYLEIVLFRQHVLCLAQAIDLVIDEIPVIDDPLTFDTDQMVMMPLTAGIVEQFIPGMTVAEIEFLNHAHLVKELKRTIDGCKSDIGADRMRPDIDVGGAQVFVGFLQDIEDNLPCRRNPDTVPIECIPPPGTFAMSVHGKLLYNL